MFTRVDKAIVAGLGAAASVLGYAQTAGSGIGPEAGLIAVVAGLIVGGLTFAFPNKSNGPS